MKYFVLYLVVINIFTFFVYGVDKIKAKYDRWRISERTLLLLALIGGFVGAFAGMQVFRHKTQHRKFTIGVPIIAILWIVVGVYLLINMLCLPR